MVSTTSFYFNTASTASAVTSTYNTGQWYHVVWTISSTGVWNLYVNNSNVIVNNNIGINGTAPFGASSSNNWFFNEAGQTTRGLYGYILDFRVYQKTLTSTEVGYLYNNQVQRY
jgi:hypothetical protein